MPIGNSGTIDERELDKIDSELSYSQSLGTAVKLILRDPAFMGEQETFSFKFIRVARFLKDNAPHAFQIREMGSDAENSVDRWLWDLLDGSGANLKNSARGGNARHGGTDLGTGTFQG